MKKVTLITAFILAAIIGNGQMYLGIGGGMSSIKNKPFVTISGGYKSSTTCLFAEGEMRVILSNYVGEKGETPANAAHFGLKGGFVLHPFKDFHILPATGFYYRLVSADDKSLNGWDLLLGSRVIYKFISLEYAKLGDYNQYSAGIIVSLN